jgi:anti-anti-sigma factor
MAASTFEAHIRHQSAVAIIDLQGEMNNFATDVLSTATEEAVSQQPAMILLNFSQVDYINSAGIALIVVLLKRVRQASCSLAACNMSEHYREIFQITRLTDYLSLFSDEASALKSAPSLS